MIPLSEFAAMDITFCSVLIDIILLSIFVGIYRYLFCIFLYSKVCVDLVTRKPYKIQRELNIIIRMLFSDQDRTPTSFLIDVWQIYCRYYIINLSKLKE